VAPSVAPRPHDNVRSWASELDGETLAQARRTAALPIMGGPVALMPDAHLGYGVCVGAVLVTDGAVIPSAVGVDIGCGMIAVETDLDASDLPTDHLHRVHAQLGQVVPAGAGRGHRGRAPGSIAAYQAGRTLDRALGTSPGLELTAAQRTTAVAQFGTLGSGNHFVEVSTDERGRVWVVLHSGSRGIGKQLADIHIDAARGAMARYFHGPYDPELAYVIEGTPEFEAYVTALTWAQGYAAANRDAMMSAVLTELFTAVGRGQERSRINCHHNFAQREVHDGRELWVTRKGAIQARVGQLGVVPGSMGTETFIVEGRGNPAAYESCSHGAGRRLSRARARRELDVAGFVDLMGARVWDQARAGETGRGALIEEDPRAYKDIHRVMADQADLVTVRHTLTQVLNYKG